MKTANKTQNTKAQSTEQISTNAPRNSQNPQTPQIPQQTPKQPIKITPKKRFIARFLSWLPVISLACGVFVFNTSEFVPIGLLSAIAQDFAMSEAGAGLLITIYAWVVALASLPLMLFFSQTELKRLMLGVIALFTLSHIASALAVSFYTLMASRIGVALAHALFWSIVSPMAVRAAPRGKRSLALSIIVTGSSLALIAGLPLGRVIGLYLHWRSTFACIGIIAALIGVLLWRVLPTMPNAQSVRFKSLPTLLANKKLRKIYLLTALFITGQFTAYSYIEPFLAQNGVSEGVITAILVLFGCSGIAASVAFSRYYDNHHLFFVNLSLFGVAASLLMLYFSAFWLPLIIAVVVFWGFAIACFNVSFQSQTINLAPSASAVAMSIYSGIYNVGIGGGALVGGIVSEDLGVGFVGFVGGGIALLACIYFVRKMSFLRVLKLRKIKKMRGVRV